MVVKSLADRIETASCSIDGAAAFLMDLVASPDLQVSRMAYSLGDLLERISSELQEIGVEVREVEPGEA